MINKNRFWVGLGAAAAGFLWSYSFSTRIGLLFVVPFWLKIIVLVGLSANFSLLANYLMIGFLKKSSSRQSALYILISSVVISILIFALAPYQRIPFRTTHRLEIKAISSEVKIKAVYSPDNNIIARDAFLFNEDVSVFTESGFFLPPGATISYQREQTGGLTLSFTLDSGTAHIIWDNQEQEIDPAYLHEAAQSKIDTWRFSSDPEKNTFNIILPGNTWGNPHPFWAFLGVLLPVSDFVLLSSLICGVLFFGVQKHNHENSNIIRSSLTKAWVDVLLCIGLAMILIKAGFPDFIPGWFLLFFLPAVLYLLMCQTHYLIKKDLIAIQCFNKLQKTISNIGAFINIFNKNRWVFWTLILIIATISSLVQLHLTQPGMGISGDSAHYLQGAQNLAQGKGYFLHIAEGEAAPITGFEPAYSMLLSAGIFVGIEAQSTARVMNSLLMFLTTILTGWIIFKTTKKVFPAVIGSLLLIMSPSIFSIYAWIMSEPLFNVLLLSSFLTWFLYIKKPSLWKALLAGFICSLMINTRLAGIVFLPILALGIIILIKTSLILRIRDAFVFSSAALITPAAFFFRNHLVTETSSASELTSLATFPEEYWRILGSEIASWFKWHVYFNLEHQRLNAMLISLGFMLVLFIIWLGFRNKLAVKSKSDPLIIVFFVSIPIYILAIILNTILLTPQQTSFGLSRYLIPIFILLVIIVSKLLSTFWEQPLLFPKIAILFLILISLQLYFIEFSDFVNDPPIHFRHYTDRKIECGTEVVTIIKNYPDVSFYSNSCEYFYFITGQQCKYLTYEDALYQPGGEIYLAVKAGDMIAYTEMFGSSPPGARSFLQDMTLSESACYIDFYRWPGTEQ